MLYAIYIYIYIYSIRMVCNMYIYIYIDIHIFMCMYMYIISSRRLDGRREARGEKVRRQPQLGLLLCWARFGYATHCAIIYYAML